MLILNAPAYLLPPEPPADREEEAVEESDREDALRGYEQPPPAAGADRTLGPLDFPDEFNDPRIPGAVIDADFVVVAGTKDLGPEQDIDPADKLPLRGLHIIVAVQ